MSVQAPNTTIDGYIEISFNTSYVSVQDKHIVKHKRVVKSFNTSYVSVQGVIHNGTTLLISSFNTSYVSVQV